LTAVIASIVSADDGYASAKGRDKLLELGVKTISISGAKGKKLTASEDWDSEEYKDARRCRSAVESLMFTIKRPLQNPSWCPLEAGHHEGFCKSLSRMDLLSENSDGVASRPFANLNAER